MVDIEFLRDTFGSSDRVALVTGAAGELGFAMARGLARAGAHLVLSDMAEDALVARTRSLNEAGLSAECAVFDVTDETAASKAVQDIIVKHGQIDIVVSNAGNQNRKPFHEVTRKEWDALIDVHLNGAFHVLRPALEQMRKQEYGRVILMSSIAALASRREIAPYSMVKGALSSLTRALAVEYGGEGITVNALVPGFMKTGFTEALQQSESFQRFIKNEVPAGRWGMPDDLVGAVVFLVSRAGGFVNGESLTIDGGLTVRF